MVSIVVTLLAQRPEAELRQMESKLEAERERVESERARVEFELTQVVEALAWQSRRAGTRPSHARTGKPARPGATQARILDAVAHFEHPVSPAQIIAQMATKGVTPSRGSIHNTIARLVKVGQLVKIDAGQYQLASRNGSSGESNAGPAENGTTEPLSTAAEFQEATNE